MTGKTLIVYSTKTGINEKAANAIADVLKATFSIDVTVADLKNGPPEIAPFQNIIVGGGVKGTSVYNEAVEFLGKDFGDRNVALFFCCEDYEDPKVLSTEDNSKKALAKNKILKPIDTAAFGGCVRQEGEEIIDTLNMDRVREWAIGLGKMFNAQSQVQQQGIGPMLIQSYRMIQSSPYYVSVTANNTGTKDLTISTAYVDGVQALVSGSLSLGAGQTTTFNVTASYEQNIAYGTEHSLQIVASDGTDVAINLAYASPNTGAMSIDRGVINSNTQITIYLRDIGSTTLNVNAAHVGDALQSMNSVVLTPEQVQTVTIMGSGTNWADGASHTVKIVAGDGTAAEISLHR
jgi:menaquinone-dependent protoporphyrinogen IX oxidase